MLDLLLSIEDRFFFDSELFRFDDFELVCGFEAVSLPIVPSIWTT